MNSFLERHGIEVGKVASVLLWSAALNGVIAMIVALTFHEMISIRLDVIVAAYLASALWEKKNRARVTTLILLWVALIATLAGMIALPFLNVKQVAIVGQPYSPGLYIRMWIMVALSTPIAIACISALSAEKTKAEFSKEPSNPVALAN